MGDHMGTSSPRSSTPAPYMERPQSAMGPSSSMQQQSMLGSHGHGLVIKDSQFRDSWARSSSGGGGFVDADDVTRFHAGIRHAGFLWKRFGQGPETKWKRLWVSEDGTVKFRERLLCSKKTTQQAVALSATIHCNNGQHTSFCKRRARLAQ